MSQVADLEAAKMAAASEEEAARVRAALDSPGGLRFVDASAIAELAKTSLGVIHQWRRRHASFPAPIVVLAVGPVWLENEVRAWLDTPRPNGRPPAAKS